MQVFLITCVILASSVSTALCKQEKNGTIRIELVRQKTAMEQHLNAPDLKKYGINFDYLKMKPHPHPQNRTNDSIALRRFLDNEFYGTIVVGHPGQKLNVAFDTAWDVSWLLSSKCNTWKTVGCWFHNLYDHTKSSEWKKDGKPFLAKEGSYNLTGFYSYDNISIAHSNVTTQSFVEMTNVPYTFLFNKVDGALGLGLRVDDYEPFFYKLLRQKKIKNPLFSIYLNRDRQSTKGGNILLGFVDKGHIHTTIYPNKTKIQDTITYLPVEPGIFWKFQVDSVVLNRTITLCPNGCKAIADTGANTIVGPEDDIEIIHNMIKAKHFLFDRYTVNCDSVNSLPKIDFVLAGRSFRLAGPAYITKISYDAFTICISAFVPTRTPAEKGIWVLGGSFLAEYYSIYNVNDKTIGFVKAA